MKNPYTFPFTAMPRLLYADDDKERRIYDCPYGIHKHDGWVELLLVYDGAGMVGIGSHRYLVHKGQILILNQGVLHDEMPSGITNIHTLCMDVDNILIDGMCKNQLIDPDIIPIIDCGECFVDVYQTWKHLCRLMYKGMPEMEGYCHYLMMSIFSIIAFQIDQTRIVAGNSDDNADQMGTAIQDYINLHFSEHLSVQSIGQAMNLSPYYMTRVFKKATGYTPMQYVTKLRLGKAQQLLLHTQKSITDIAMEIGYNNLSNFNYSFMKLCGISPSRYRKEFIGK